MKLPPLDIVIPAYHEEDNIEKTIEGISHNVHTKHRILVVWQDKKDPTIPVLRRLQKKHKNLYLIQSMQGVGVVKALVTGLKTARANTIVIMMADLSDNPKDIDKMVRKIDKGYDLVCASRYSGKGDRVGGPVMKGILSRVGCITLRFLSGIPTNDATNAFKCLRRNILDDISIESVGGFELPLELTVKAYKNGKKVTEVPTVWHERESGASKFKLLQWFPQYVRWYMYAIVSKENLRRIFRA
jgi:dolichol-phosphate mannosyltransferase